MDNLEIQTLYQQRWLKKSVPAPELGENIGKYKMFLQYRVRSNADQKWSKWMDVVTDVEGETPNMIY